MVSFGNGVRVFIRSAILLFIGVIILTCIVDYITGLDLGSFSIIWSELIQNIQYGLALLIIGGGSLYFLLCYKGII